MTLSEFVKKYTNQFVEYHSYDPRAKNQCTDLANQWLVEGLGLQAIIGTNAIDFPSKAVANGMDWIPNTPEGIPQPGDLIVYEGAVGHIDIALEGCTTSKIVAFSQNYPTGSPCVVRTGTYLRPKVVGWISPKGIMNSDEMIIKKTDFERMVTEGTAYKDIIAKYNVADAQGLYNMVAGLQSRITTLGNDLGTAQAEMKNREEQVARLKEQIANLTNELNNLTNSLKVKIGEYEDLAVAKGKQYIELQQALTTIDTLRQQVQQGEISITLKDLFSLIWNQKITIKKG